MMNRREWIAGSALLPGMVSGAAAPQGRNIVIASANGLKACARAMQGLKAGEDTLDAAIAGVNINEEDPNDNSVGYGGLPNEDGIVELDASVMHGPTRRCGAVASLRNIKTPSKVARAVMTETDHIMLAGEGALRFAKAMGFVEEDLLTEQSRIAWLLWKKSLRDGSGSNNWNDGLDSPKNTAALFPGVDERTLARAWEMVKHPPTGTISCLALNSRGEMSGVTTTSGLAWKIAGRVGDSPIPGAGLWVDQDWGAAGSTGRGEENIRIAGAHTVVENMRHGMTAKEAVLDALKRVSSNFNGDRARLNRFDLNFYALRKDGDYAGGSLWNGRMRDGRLLPSRFAVNDGGESRLETCVFLYERR